MARTHSLRFKVSLWMLVNFTIVGSVVFALLIWKFGFGWEALVQGPAGDRFEDVAEAAAGEMREDPTADPADVFARHVPRDGADWMMFSGDGVQRAGPSVELPEELLKLVRVGSGRRRPPPQVDRAPPRDRPGPPAASELPDPEQLAIGRLLFRAPDSQVFWVGVRIPVYFPDGPRPGVMLVRVRGALALAGLLGVPALLAVATGAAALSVLLWLPFVGGLTRDLRRVHAATERIAGGDLTARVVVPRSDEIGGLADSVNQMAERLEAFTGGQKRFLAGVAHELGSPIGCLQILVGLLETRSLIGIENTVSDVRQEVERMAALVNELLMFTKSEMQPREVELTDVNLAVNVAAALKRENAEACVRLDVDWGLIVRADDLLLSRAFGNLVRNAVRYAGNAGPITIAAQADDHQVRIAVADNGAGVPPETLERLGEPFYRPESARSRETGGVGLGLAIVVASIRACGGNVRFANRRPHGFLAEITLARTEQQVVMAAGAGCHADNA